VTELWRWQYSGERPHSSLRYHTPEEFAVEKKENARMAAPAVEGAPLRKTPLR
jgi:hypothetical protein